MSLFENPLKKLADFESLEESIKKRKVPVTCYRYVGTGKGTFDFRVDERR